MQLREMKCFRATDVAHAFGGAEVVAPQELEAVEGPALVIAPHVVPDEAAEYLIIEAALLQSGKTIGFPTISAVSGLFVEPGLTFLPAGRRMAGAAELLLPHCAGRFAGNETPEQAFRTSHALWSGAVAPDGQAERKRMALAISLGAEVQNGEWWLAGALAGVLGLGAEAELTHLRAAPADLLPMRVALARRARRECDLPVQVFDAQQSAVLKGALSEYAPADYWLRFADACDQLGMHEIAARYRTACRRVWTVLT